MFIQNRDIPIFIFAFLIIGILQSCNQSSKGNAENTQDSASLAKTYTARGNEPFWSVTIKEPNIIFKTPEQEVSYPYAAPEKASKLITFASSMTSDSLNSNIHITISFSECFDTMSGEAFPYTVNVIKDGTTYTGCAKENN